MLHLHACIAILLCYDDIAVDECQRRWKTLRERFVKELKKKNKPTGSGATVCAPWELFGHMEFIKDFVKHRK